MIFYFEISFFLKIATGTVVLNTKMPTKKKIFSKLCAKGALQKLDSNAELVANAHMDSRICANTFIHIDYPTQNMENVFAHLIQA